MWVGEVLDGERGVVQEYWLKGPSINIGRSVENEMVFSADKSISRVHARIVIDGANSTVNVTDLASRYGTSVSGTKLQPNEPFPVEHGGIIRFGVGGIRVRLVRKQYAFCLTRLEKPQKDQIKRCAKLLSAKIVTQVEQATHVVATKAAATLKMISALVLPLKLVTVEWTSFAETSKTGVVIPSVDDFVPPPTADITIKEIKADRSALLSSHLIFLMNAYDEQYAQVCLKCGATVISCWREEEESGLAAPKVVAKALASNPNKSNICMFYDESRGIESDKKLMDQCRAASKGFGNVFKWLTAGQLAGAIINLIAPVLYTDPPRALKVPISGSFNSQSQLTGGVSQLPVSLPVCSISVKSNNRPALINELPLLVPPSLPEPTNNVLKTASSTVKKEFESPKPEKVFQGVGVNSIIPSGVNTELSLLVPEQDGKRKRKPDVPAHAWDDEEPIPGGSKRRRGHDKVNPNPADSSPLRVDSRSNPSILSRSDSPSSGGIVSSGLSYSDFDDKNKTGNHIKAGMRASRGELATFDDELFSESDIMKATTSRPLHAKSFAIESASDLAFITHSNESNSEREVVAETIITKRLTKSSNFNVDSPKSSTELMRGNVQLVNSSVFIQTEPGQRESLLGLETIDTDGWVETLRGAEREAVIRMHKDQLSLVTKEETDQENGKDMDLEDQERLGSINFEADGSRLFDRNQRLHPADAVEREFTLRTPLPLSAMLVASNSSHHSKRNVKVFRKNSVARVQGGEQLRFSSMQLVLPKESEREIQLRLEADARRELEAFADHMMTDKFLAGAVRRKL